MAKPILKWVGGKTQILDCVLALFPTTIQNYHEPFVGGGSVLLGFLEEVRANKRTLSGTVYASDSNPNLIALYQHLQTNPQGLLQELERMTALYAAIPLLEGEKKPATLEEAKTSRESYYYWIRSQYNEEKASLSLKVSAMMVFLNRTGWRGVYRENKEHIYNVPFGFPKKVPTIYEKDNFLRVSALLQGVVFTCQNFESSFSKMKAGDFTYLDPPYAPESEKSFVDYTGNGFSLNTHKKLFALCQGLKAKPIQMLLSNANVPLVNEHFPEPRYEVNIVPAKRTIHCDDPGTMTEELLILNK